MAQMSGRTLDIQEEVNRILKKKGPRRLNKKSYPIIMEVPKVEESYEERFANSLPDWIYWIPLGLAFLFVFLICLVPMLCWFVYRLVRLIPNDSRREALPLEDFPVFREPLAKNFWDPLMKIALEICVAPLQIWCFFAKRFQPSQP